MAIDLARQKFEKFLDETLPKKDKVGEVSISDVRKHLLEVFDRVEKVDNYRDRAQKVLFEFDEWCRDQGISREISVEIAWEMNAKLFDEPIGDLIKQLEAEGFAADDDFGEDHGGENSKPDNVTPFRPKIK